jgi:hypothetical protein
LQTKQTRHKVTGPRQEYKEMSTLCARSRTPLLLLLLLLRCTARQKAEAERFLYTSEPPTRLPLTQLSPTNQTTRQPTQPTHSSLHPRRIHREINTPLNCRSSISFQCMSTTLLTPFTSQMRKIKMGQQKGLCH